VAVFKKSSGRFHVNTAEAAAAAVVSHIEKAGKAVESVTPAGSLRRGKETVGDLDLLVTLADGHTSQKHVDALAQHILAFPGIDQTLAHGENKVSFTLENGLQVDVRMLEKENFGAALLYFTGSKEHNVALRGRANDMGLTLNEYALATLKGEKRVAGRSEEEIYSKLKLDFIPSELRENTGEIAAAENHKLPHLLTLKDMKGDLQMHSTASDGKNSIEEWLKRRANSAPVHCHHRPFESRHGRQRPGRKGDGRTHQENSCCQRQRPGHPRSGRGGSGHPQDGALDYSDDILAQLDVVVCRSILISTSTAPP